MAKSDLEAQKEDILKKLQDAGKEGLNKTELKVTSKADNLRIEAFKALEKGKKIVNSGTLSKPRYLLQELYRPLEMAYEKIEEHLLAVQKPDKMKLVSLSNLKKMLKNLHREADKAIALLLKENKLLKVKHGNGTYFLHAHPVLESLSFARVSPEKSVEKPSADLTIERVLEAYQNVKQRIGFSNVEIYELQQELGTPMEQVQAFLLEENRKGKAVLSLGDWSLSSEKIRSGAIHIDGKPYLLVRFKE